MTHSELYHKFWCHDSVGGGRDDTTTKNPNQIKTTNTQKNQQSIMKTVVTF